MRRGGRASLGFALLVATLLAGLLAACGSGSDGPAAAPSPADPATPTAVVGEPTAVPRDATPTSQATPTPRPTPEAAYGDRVFVTADDPAIDAIIAAVRARDVDALIELTRVREWPCVAPQPVTRGAPRYEFGPSCREGEEAGTVVEGVTVLSCSGSVSRHPDLRKRYQFDLGWGMRLYTVFRGTEHLESVWPDYDAAILFVFRDPADELDVPWGLVVDDGAIVGVDVGCGESPKQELDLYRGRSYLLPPPYWREGAQPIDAPPDRRSGEPAIDAIIDAVLAGESRAPLTAF